MEIYIIGILGFVVVGYLLYREIESGGKKQEKLNQAEKENEAYKQAIKEAHENANLIDGMSADELDKLMRTRH